MWIILLLPHLWELNCARGKLNTGPFLSFLSLHSLGERDSVKMFVGITRAERKESDCLVRTMMLWCLIVLHIVKTIFHRFVQLPLNWLMRK